jgi:hypothetical protein
MTVLLTLMGRLGVPLAYRRAVAIAALAATALMALAVLKGCYDRSVIERHQAQFDRRVSKARDQAEVERIRDAAIANANRKDLDHAIDTAPRGGALSPAAHALACERLRKLGRVPAACRPRGSD